MSPQAPVGHVSHSRTTLAGALASFPRANLARDRRSTTCPTDSFWDSKSATCQPWLLCSAGQLQSAAPTATSNRVCSRCPQSTFQDASNHALPGCKPVSTGCAIGSFELSAPTESQDRQCQPCPAGSFQSLVGEQQCLPGRDACPAGTFEAAPLTPQQDRLCLPCNPDSFQPRGGQLSCVQATVCAAGSYQTAAPTTTTDRQCLPCRTSCPDASYLTGSCQGSENPVCQPCHTSCATCSGPRANQCLTCPLNRTRTIGGICDDQCTGSYSDSKLKRYVGARRRKEGIQTEKVDGGGQGSVTGPTRFSRTGLMFCPAVLPAPRTVPSAMAGHRSSAWRASRLGSCKKQAVCRAAGRTCSCLAPPVCPAQRAPLAPFPWPSAPGRQM
jgi:hypothetical protein